MRHIFKASFEQQDDAEHLLEALHAAGYTGATLALSGATHAGRFTRRRFAVALEVDADTDMGQALTIIERHKPARLQDDEHDSIADDMDAAGSDHGGEGGRFGADPWSWHKVKETIRHGWDRVRHRAP